MLAFGWEFREVGNSGNFYAFRPRVGDLGARSTTATNDVAAVVKDAYQIQVEIEPDPRAIELEEDDAFYAGPMLDVPALSSAAVAAIIRYNNSMTAAMIRHEIRQEIAAAMAAAQQGDRVRG